MATQPKAQVDTRVVVETPEGVDFRFVIAGPGKRGISFLIDWLLKATVVGFAIFISTFFALFGDLGQGFFGFGFLITLFLLDWGYGSLFEAFWNGQTPGKRLLSLRVVRTNGTPITFLTAVGRNFLLAADQQPAIIFPLFTVGIIATLTSRRMQRLGDRAFDTMVVDETRDWITRSPGITQGVEALTRAECPRRFHVPERTLAVIERLFESDRIIPDLRREEIAKTLSVSLRKRLGYEEPAPPQFRNPHAYFERSPLIHTLFLRRVLKTFVDDKNTDEEARRNRLKTGVAETALRSNSSSRRPGLSKTSENDQDVSLDQWVSSANIETIDTNTDWIVGENFETYGDQRSSNL
ncbi:MAG: RDD family protein [Planctomyces sp.]|nr:RDD family protein [Planctomyces sp.]